MLILCDEISPRLEYTVKVLFERLCKSSYEIMKYKDFKEAQGEFIINYREEPFVGALNVEPAGLLESGSRMKNVPVGSHAGEKVLFPSAEGFFPFDLFSASFFMLSRMEEYGDVKLDEHGRFPLKSQLSYREGFHKKAIVHRWMQIFIDELQSMNNPPELKLPEFSYQVTFDIDNAYAFRHKSLIRSLGSTVLHPNTIGKRMATLSGSSADPYDTYEYLKETLKDQKEKALFFLLCRSNGKYDRNIAPDSKAFKDLTHSLGQWSNLGLHPSYDSNDQEGLLEKEKSILGHEVASSRQHYLRFRLPETPRRLLEHGFKHEYSMGFAEESGFRAGIAVPFPFYDLEKEKETELIFHAFQFMESPYVYRGKEGLQKGRSDLSDAIDEVKKYGGNFIPVWHNESLSEWSHFKGWGKVYEGMLQKLNS